MPRNRKAKTTVVSAPEEQDLPHFAIDLNGSKADNALTKNKKKPNTGTKTGKSASRGVVSTIHGEQDERDESESEDHDENVEDESEGESDDMPQATDGSDESSGPEEPDDVEAELQRLVFGDDVGFRQGLENFSTTADDGFGILSSNQKKKQAKIKGTTTDPIGPGLLDQDFFVMDTGGDTALQHTTAAASNLPAATSDADEDDDDHDRQPNGFRPAWEDSDDDRLAVSLASVPMLRKLRKSEAEDLVSGKEYVKRLRRRYELLHPRPEWAVEACMHRPAKRLRRNHDDDDNDDAESVEDEDIEMDDGDDGDDVVAAQPLAQLLRNSTSLVRKSDALQSSGTRRLRPEVIDIQRTRDVPGMQPSAITSLSFHPEYPFLLSSGPSSTLYLHYINPSPGTAPVTADATSSSPHQQQQQQQQQQANPLLTSLHIKGTPLSTTAFHPHDSRIFLSARRRYFHIWNLDSGRVEKITRVHGHTHEQRSMERFKLSPCGRFMALLASTRKGGGGAINILDAYTLQWRCAVRVEGRGGVGDFSWYADGSGMCIVSKSGEVTEWNVEMERVVARWVDQGAVGITTLALGGIVPGMMSMSVSSKRPGHGHRQRTLLGPDRWVAIGSSSGVVNIYDRKPWLSSTPTSSLSSLSAPSSTEPANEPPPIPHSPTPLKVLDNLTTPISTLTFAPDGQILAISSRWKKDALRLVHLPSATVFKNWPTGKTPLGRVTGTAFGRIPSASSPSSGTTSGLGKSTPMTEVLAVANEAGKIRLWEIRA